MQENNKPAENNSLPSRSNLSNNNNGGLTDSKRSFKSGVLDEASSNHSNSNLSNSNKGAKTSVSHSEYQNRRDKPSSVNRLTA